MISLLSSTPGLEPSLEGFLVLSGAEGFLVQDVVPLGTAVWSLGEALK
jgi:hypothetical protein